MCMLWTLCVSFAPGPRAHGRVADAVRRDGVARHRAGRRGPPRAPPASGSTTQASRKGVNGLEQPDADVELTVRVNLLGAMHGTRAAIEVMRPAGGGHILNIASMSSFGPVPGVGARRRDQGRRAELHRRARRATSTSSGSRSASTRSVLTPPRRRMTRDVRATTPDAERSSSPGWRSAQCRQGGRRSRRDARRWAVSSRRCPVYRAADGAERRADADRRAQGDALDRAGGWRAPARQGRLSVRFDAAYGRGADGVGLPTRKIDDAAAHKSLMILVLEDSADPGSCQWPGDGRPCPLP